MFGIDGIIAFVVALALLLSVAIVGAFAILRVIVGMIDFVKSSDPHAPGQTVEEIHRMD